MHVVNDPGTHRDEGTNGNPYMYVEAGPLAYSHEVYGGGPYMHVGGSSDAHRSEWAVKYPYHSLGSTCGRFKFQGGRLGTVRTRGRRSGLL